MAQPKPTHWAFYKGEWRHCWLQNTHKDVSHEVLTSPRPDGKLDCWIHEDKQAIYTEMQLFAWGINPKIQTQQPLDQVKLYNEYGLTGQQRVPPSEIQKA